MANSIMNAARIDTILRNNTGALRLKYFKEDDSGDIFATDKESNKEEESKQKDDDSLVSLDF